MQLGGTTGGAEQLKGDNGDEADELDGLRRGGGRGRLHLELSRANVDEGDMMLGSNSSP